MVELEREDIHAALLLSWLKYTLVTQEDVAKMNDIHFLATNNSKKMENQETPQVNFSRNSSGSAGKTREILGKLKRKFERIKETGNQETPEVELPQKMRNSTCEFMGFSRNSSGSAGKPLGKSKRKRLRTKKTENQETPQVKLPKKVRDSSSGLMGNSDQNPKRVRVSPSTLMGLPKKSPGCVPELPPMESLRPLIGECSNPFTKQLTLTDVNKQQGRLLLNNEDVRKQLLPMLKGKFENLANGIKVKTYDPMGNSYNMKFKTWVNNKSYVLVGGWKQFVIDHNLKENDCVTIWMFRCNKNGELCFALTWRKYNAAAAAATRVAGTDPEVFRSGDEARVVSTDSKTFRSDVGTRVVGSNLETFRSGDKARVSDMDPEAFRSGDGKQKEIQGEA